uniref:WAP domain-containing protein n=1 Tax=Callithrix jacchus TaxID=9483 RepID=A0A5F4W6J1_CALJA
MKLAAFLLLVILIIFSLEVQELQAALRPREIYGICIERCSGDWDCDPGEHCISNGCGHVCAAQ